MGLLILGFLANLLGLAGEKATELAFFDA